MASNLENFFDTVQMSSGAFSRDSQHEVNRDRLQ